MANDTFAGSSVTTVDRLVHVNSVDSNLGSGWGIAGVQELVENADGSVLLIDGDGSDTVFEVSKTNPNEYAPPASDFSELVKLADGTFQRTTKDNTVFRFDEKNRLVSVTDKNQNVTQHIYSEDRLVKMIDPAGLATDLSYENGRVSRITDPAGRVTELTYDVAGNLVEIIDPDATKRTFGYDSEHHMTSEVDKQGYREEAFYDFAGRASHAVRKDGSIVRLNPVQVQGLYRTELTSKVGTAPTVSATQSGAVSDYADANGNVTRSVLDKSGRRTTSFDGEGRSPSIIRDENYLVQSRINTMGASTSYKYDDFGNVIEIANSAAPEAQFIDISQSGQVVEGIQGRDDESAMVDLPFAVDFYGQSYSQIGINSNGLLSFGGTNSAYSNYSLGDGENLNGLPSILPFWDDLETRTDEGFSASVLTETIGQQSGRRQFVIQWHEVEAYSSGSQNGSITFQTIFTEGSDQIQFNYQDVHFEGETEVEHGQGRSATIGIWNSNSEFQQYSFDDASLEDGVSLLVSERGIVKASEAASATVTSKRQYTYDSVFNQVTSTTDELGRQTLYGINENGDRTEYLYDAMNRQVQVISADPDGADGELTSPTMSLTYDARGNVTSQTDANGNVSFSEYDEMGRLVKATDALGSVTEYEHDAGGNLVATTDALGRTTESVYDSRGRSVETIRADGSRVKTGYDAGNNRTQSFDANGNASRTVYDERNRVSQVIDALGNVTSFEYDAAGQMTAQIDANGDRADYEYDELGRRASVTDALGNVTRTSYDKAGRVFAQIDALGKEIRYEYDDRDRQIATIDPLNSLTTTTYDAVGNVLSITDAVNNTTSYVYDDLNRLIAETNELEATRYYRYDAQSNRIAAIDRNGRERAFLHDGLNRQVEEQWLDEGGTAIRSARMVYDAAGQLVEVSDPDSTYRYSYDSLGRQVAIDNAGTPDMPNVVLNYAYDDAGNIVSVTDTIDGVAGGTNTYRYDALNRTTQVTQSGNSVSDKRVDFTYTPVGQFETIHRYSDLAGDSPVVTTTYSYDDSRRIERIGHSNTAEEVAFYDYTYDSANRITSITDVDGISNYSYNGRDELTGAIYSNGSNPEESYGYDANGNRESSSIHNDGYVSGSNNQLIADGVYTYEYDDEGNMTRQTETATGEVRVFEWDYLNRLVGVVDADRGRANK